MNDNKTKILLMIIAVLLIANISWLALYFQKSASDKSHFRQDRKTAIEAFLKKDVGFSQEQLVKFDSLSEQHRRKVSQTIDADRMNRAEQFKILLAANFSDSMIKELAQKSAAVQLTTETLMLIHMKEIRQLCQPEQLAAFDASFGKTLSRRAGTDNKKKSH